jgi:hypothetical protein
MAVVGRQLPRLRNWLAAAQNKPMEWKKDGLLFAVRYEGSDYFPSFALDPAVGYQPVAALAKVLTVNQQRSVAHSEFDVTTLYPRESLHRVGSRPAPIGTPPPKDSDDMFRRVIRYFAGVPF